MQRTASSIHYNKNTIHKRRSHTTLPYSLASSFAACGKSSPEIVWVNRIYIITQFNILICPTNCFAPTTNTLICFYMVHGKCFSKYLLKKMTKKKKRTCERANWSILLLLFMHCSVFTARCSMLMLVVQCSVFCVTISGFLYSTDDYGIRRNLTLINLPDNDIVRFVSFGLATNFLFSLRLLWKTQERILIECAKIIISVGCEWRAYFIRILYGFGDGSKFIFPIDRTHLMIDGIRSDANRFASHHLTKRNHQFWIYTFPNLISIPDPYKFFVPNE